MKQLSEKNNTSYIQAVCCKTQVVKHDATTTKGEPLDQQRVLSSYQAQRTCQQSILESFISHSIKKKRALFFITPNCNSHFKFSTCYLPSPDL